MIGVFKRRDGWVLEKELPGLSPPQYYTFAMIRPFSFGELISEDENFPEISVGKVEFCLVDYWQNSAHKYIKVFYEEI